MMMNQVDSSSFDDDKDDDKKPKRMISRWSQQVQDQDKIKIRNDIKKNQDSREDDFTREVLKRIFQKPNIAQFCFTRKVFLKIF